MSRHKRLRASEEAHRQLREIEAEYDVDITWAYSPRDEYHGKARSLATVSAVPLPWSDMPVGRWVVSGEVIESATGAREAKAHMNLLCSLMCDLQMARAFGVTECEHHLPAED